MNFIYTILLFAFISAVGFTTGTFLPAGNWWNAAITVGVIGLIASTVTLIISAFRNMEFRNEINRHFNEIKENLRDVKSIKKEMSEYKDEITDSLTKLYPDYEKEMFKNMNPSDVENISALMIKYPELKFNGVLENYTNKLSKYITECNARERCVNDYLRRIENAETCGWMLIKVAKPAFIQKIIDQEFE